VIFRVEYRQALSLLSKMRKTAPRIRKRDFLACASVGNLEQHFARSYR